MKYTEQEVRYMAYECGKVFGTDWSISQMLTAYADMLAAQPVAVPDASKVDEAAKKLADRFDYTWEFMPSEGQNRLRNLVQDIAAILSAAASTDAKVMISREEAIEFARSVIGHESTTDRMDSKELRKWVGDQFFEFFGGGAEPAAEGAKVAAAQCETCGGTGEVGGPFGQTPDSFGYDTVACPDCTSAQPAEVLSEEQIRNIADPFICNIGGVYLGESGKGIEDRDGDIEKFARAIERAVLAQPSGRIAELETALAESRANDQTAMGYLTEIHEIVGGDDFPAMVKRVKVLAKPSGGDEQFCYCGEEVSLQMVSGGGHADGLYGRITLRVGSDLVEFVRASGADKYKTAYDEWIYKTDWLKPTVKELGKHRADILRERIEALESALAQQQGRDAFAEGSPAQKAFWAGYESCVMQDGGKPGNIRLRWNQHLAGIKAARGG